MGSISNTPRILWGWALITSSFIYMHFYCAHHLLWASLEWEWIGVPSSQDVMKYHYPHFTARESEAERWIDLPEVTQETCSRARNGTQISCLQVTDRCECVQIPFFLVGLLLLISLVLSSSKFALWSCCCCTWRCTTKYTMLVFSTTARRSLHLNHWFVTG